MSITANTPPHFPDAAQFPGLLRPRSRTCVRFQNSSAHIAINLHCNLTNYVVHAQRAMELVQPYPLGPPARATLSAAAHTLSRAHKQGTDPDMRAERFARASGRPCGRQIFLQALVSAAAAATDGHLGPVHRRAVHDAGGSAHAVRRRVAVVGPGGQGGACAHLGCSGPSWHSPPPQRSDDTLKKSICGRIERNTPQGTGGVRGNREFGRGERGGVAAWRRREVAVRAPSSIGHARALCACVQVR